MKKDDFVLDSEYLVTLLVVVPKLNHNDWIKQYETLAEMVVPRSSNVLSEDQDSYLCNVTLFRRQLMTSDTKPGKTNSSSVTSSIMKRR